MIEKVIAVGADQEGKIWTRHFGMAPFYYIFDRQGALLEKRENPYSEAGKDHDDPTLIVELLPECDTFLARRIGVKSRQKLAGSLGVNPVLVTEAEAEAAVHNYLMAQQEAG